MEHISLPSFDIASGDSNEEFIHGDPVDPLGESQYDGNYDTIGVHSSWKTSSEELEANNINTKDDHNTLLVENDIEVKPRIEDLQNSIKKEEQTWNRDFLESVLYDVKNVKIEKFEPDVCHNLISYSNYPENEERIICKQESTPTTTFESTNPELEEASFSTRESVVERNGSNDNHNSSKTEKKKQKCNVYQDPSSPKTTISDKPKQSDTIDNLDDSSTGNGWEEPSDDFAENDDHTPPGTPIDKPIMVADNSKITGGSKDSKITEICSNDNDDEDISKRNSSEMLSKKRENFEIQMYQDCTLSKLLSKLLTESPNIISHKNDRNIANNNQYSAKNIQTINKKYEKTDIFTLNTCKSLKAGKVNHLLTFSNKKKDNIQTLPKDLYDNKNVKSVKRRKNTDLLKSQTALKKNNYIKKLNFSDDTDNKFKHTSLRALSPTMSYKNAPELLKHLVTKQILSAQDSHNLNARDDLILSTAGKLNNTSLTNFNEGMENQSSMSSSNSSNNYSYNNGRTVPAKIFQTNLEEICLDSTVTQNMTQNGFKNKIDLKCSEEIVKRSISSTEKDKDFLSQFSNGNKNESQSIECIIDLAGKSDSETDTQSNKFDQKTAGITSNEPKTETHNILKHLLESESTPTPARCKSDDRLVTDLNNFMTVEINKNVHSGKKNVNNEKSNGQLLKSNGFIIKHMVCSSGFEIKYVCIICNKGFFYKSGVIKHISQVHCELRNHVCVKCGKAFKTASYLKIHIDSVHSSDKQLKCLYCNKVFRHSLLLKSHIYKHHKNKGCKTPKTCDLCQKTLSSSDTLSSHMKSQHKITDEHYICNECSAVFNEKRTLTSHIKAKHLPPEYKCSKCSLLFHTSGQLKNHSYNQHMIDKKSSIYVCEVCGKVCRAKMSLSQHILTHFEEKQFSCEECGKCFRTASNLSQHSVIHKDKRPYACYLCDKAFRIRNHLKQHMAVHGMVSTSASKKRKRSNSERK